MKVDLGAIPEGWFLYRLAHEHTRQIYAGDVHTPMNLKTHGKHPWVCELQHVKGGRMTRGFGVTARGAVGDSILKVKTGRWGVCDKAKDDDEDEDPGDPL